MIDLEHVSKEYKRGGPLALDDINLHVDDGEFVFLLGHSGAGKSTLLKLLLREELPSEGKVTVLGKDVASLHRHQVPYLRRQMGIIFQDFRLIPTMTVYENIAFAMHVTNVKSREISDRVEYMLELVHLEDKAKAYPAQLSGGQQQRVAIARALATRPKYLLCDEATSALDPNTTQSILHLLKEINQTLGVTIVVITHEMRVIEQICQRVAVIDQSCIAEIGNVSDVFTHPKSDIAKALILPKSPAENLPPCTGRRLRLVFDGSCSNEPVISRITLECHVPVNILFADTRIVEGSIYGHMVIDLPDDPQQFHDVLRWLDHNHISYLQEDGSHV